jgi:hypothetical protein
VPEAPAGGSCKASHGLGIIPRLVREGRRPVQKENLETLPQLAAPYHAAVTNVVPDEIRYVVSSD